MSKRKHFSKALTILLAVVMVFTMMPAMAWAEGDGGDPVTLPDASITVPSDAELFVGSKTKHYVSFTKEDAAQTVENAENSTTTYYFNLTDKSTYNYRVSGEKYITYAGTFKKTAGYSLNVTEEMLQPAGITKKTIDRDVKSNNGYNVADIYLNINPQGYLRLTDMGNTYQIVNLRNWEAVDSTTNNYFIEPDYHYEVIDEAGSPSSNVVTIDENGLITAVGEGTAIVLVTYDAINIPTAIGGPFFGAIWPENTGVFVVSVGAGESGIETGMTINEGKNTTDSKLSGDAIDAEHDVIYFAEEKGEYTFTPGTDGVSISVANPTVSDKMTFSGFKEVNKNSDNSVTIPLVEGRNIVKLEKNGKSEYQVITAKKVRYTINGGKPVKAGDPISIVFDTIYHPSNKLAGVYNMSAVVAYENPDGQLVGGLSNQYQFASNSNAQTVKQTIKKGTGWMPSYAKDKDLTIPEGYNKDTYKLENGTVMVLGFGDPYGNHRGITLTDGKAPNFNANVKEASLGKLPDIEIPIIATDAEISRIDLTTNNVKVNYFEGEAFDTSNLVVKATYEDNVTQIATNYSVTPEILSKDTKEVTISYRGKTATIPVTVNERKVQDLEVTKAPTKTVYTVGEVFNPSGIEITATYEGEVKKDVTEDVTYYDTVFNAAGDDVKVTVSYTEKGITKTTTQNVKVNEAGGAVPEDNITVSFTLLGDDNHGEPTEITGTHTLKNHNLKTWIGRTNVNVPKGSKVIDVIEKALGIAGIPFTNQSGNYIDTIRGLGEFSNGSLSGWMYTLNGTHPNLGVAEQTVKNGDVIVLHYTDDYTAEQGSEEWIVPDEANQAVTTSGPSGSATTTTPTEVTVTGDTAKVTVKTKNMTEAIKQAKENKSAEIVLDVKADDVKTAAKVSAELPASAIKQIANDTTAALAVSTPMGKAIIDRETLSEIAKSAEGLVVTIEVSKNSDGKMEVAVKSAGKTLYTSVEETQDPEADQQTKLEKIKTGVKATTLTARSKRVKTSSGKTAIKVTWTKSKGYKVDYYEVFRSTKKSSFSKKPFYTTKNAKNPATRTYYVNTKSLKKGTTYYYKVRGVRIINGEKVYTKWSKMAIRKA